MLQSSNMKTVAPFFQSVVSNCSKKAVYLLTGVNEIYRKLQHLLLSLSLIPALIISVLN